MSWIRVIDPGEAEGPLRDIYRRSAGPDSYIDNVLQIPSLRPHTLEAHMALVREEQIAAMREAGLSDGEIQEVNQVTSYFACVNRTVLALGVTTQGGLLGLSPNDTSAADNWRHS
jgi:hypothetical protein